MLNRQQRALLALYAVVPYPFFFLGIPFATAGVLTCFRATCIFFSVSSFAALAFKEYYHIACRSALFWNGFSSCVVAYAWCAPWLVFVAFQIVENAFQYLSVTLLLEKKGRTAHIVLTFLGSVFGFLVRETNTAASDDVVHRDRRLNANATSKFAGEDVDKEDAEEKAMHWAVSLITLVCCLVLGMCAIGYLTTNTFSWLRRLRHRRIVAPHEGDFDALMPEASVIGVPASAWIDAEAEAAEAWERGIDEISGHLVTKSMRELRHLAATSCVCHADLESVFIDDIDRERLMDKVTTDIACGMYDLACMSPQHLKEVALRMGISYCRSVGVGETVDPRRQLLRWIVLRTGQIGRASIEQSETDSVASDNSQWVSAKYVRFAIVEALAATPLARQRVRTHRARFTGQVGKDEFAKLSTIPEEEEEYEAVGDLADEISVASPFGDDTLSLSTCTQSTGMFV